MSAGKHHIKFSIFGIRFTFSVEDDLRKALVWALPLVGTAKIDAIIAQIVALYDLNEQLRAGS